MNEFIKERFSYLADNKKENVPELNVSYGSIRIFCMVLAFQFLPF